MSKVITVAFDIADSDATAGEALNTERLRDFSIQMERTSGSFILQASNDGTNFQNISGAITADALFSSRDPTTPLPVAKRYRIFTTTAGTFVATLHGLGPD